MIENDQIRLLIVDDHHIVNEGLAYLASVRKEFELVGRATDGLDAIELARRFKPDVVLMDLQMPKMNGIDATKFVREVSPNSKVLVLSSFAEDKQIFAVMNAGASGYLLKDTSPNDLMQAILDVHNGGTPMHESVSAKLMGTRSAPDENQPASDRLTDRERDVLRHLSCGLTNKEISREMYVSARTVGAHIGRILEKLELENRTQAALYAQRNGIVKK